MSIRAVTKATSSVPTMEGAGVKLRRAFGFDDPEEFDPFLLLDDFRNDRPEDYLAGFPWHPHRGIETITYVLSGTVEHGDSLGNRGSLGAGDVQWMTAGRGIVHQEMPQGSPDGRMHGFQLWANLPSTLKMTAPRYQDVQAVDIPTVTDDDGTGVRVVCGSFWGCTGPVDGIAAEPIYLDVSVPAGLTKRLPVETSRHAFAYIFEGSGRFADASSPRPVEIDHVDDAGAPPITAEELGDRTLVSFGRGDEVVVRAGERGIRFLLVSGKPIQEPVAWAGPIVMNTRAELREAFSQLNNGTFLQP
jgi:quercetin 2,3-dioxygenase